MTYDSIALCGGGGKGAYQIGVMKAMAETGVLGQIEYISGTSVGALNAVLYAIGDVELAERVWLEYVTPNVMIKNYDAGRSEISRDGLRAMLRYIGLNKLRNRPLVYIYAHNIRLDRPEKFLLNGRSEENITTLLLASSSIPVVYSPVDFHGEKYKDGGCTPLGNHPIEVLADGGCRNIILVPLNSSFNPYAVSNSAFGESFNIYQRFPGVNFRIIKPSLDIGKFFNGTIDFRTDSIRERMALGYNDAIGILSTKKGEDVIMDINVNDRIRRLAAEVLKTSQDFEDFVSISKFKHLNIKLKVLRAEVCYDTIYALGGWTIEWHKVLPLKNHYRIIDPFDRRRAWTLDPDELVKNLILFKESKSRS